MTKELWFDTLELAFKQSNFEGDMTDWTDNEDLNMDFDVPPYIKDYAKELLVNAPYQALNYLSLGMNVLHSNSNINEEKISEVKAYLRMCKDILVYIDSHK